MRCRNPTVCFVLHRGLFYGFVFNEISLKDIIMLKQYIREKVYLGIPLDKCPLSYESMSGLEDKYYMEISNDRLYIFLNESFIQKMGLSYSIAGYESGDRAELCGQLGISYS